MICHLGHLLFQTFLKIQEFVFDTVETYEDLEEMSKWLVFDLIIITDNIPSFNIIKFIDKYRSEKGLALILTVLNKSSVYSVVDVLDFGSDDCIRLPCHEDEVSAKLRSLFKAK